MTLNLAGLDAKAKNKQNSKLLLTGLSADYFSIFLDKKYPDTKVRSSSKLKLSQEFLKHYDVQRILCDLGGRLEDFLNNQFKDNLMQIEDYLQDPDFDFMSNPAYNSAEKAPKKVTGQRPNSVQAAAHRFSRGDPASTFNKLSSPESPMRTSPGRGLIKTKMSSPFKLGRREVTGGDPQGSPTENSENNHQMYCYSALGQNFIKCMGKTDLIKDNLVNIVSEMDDNVTVGRSKTKVDKQDMAELFATKERVVNILEEILEKEYTTPQDMAEMIAENWDITEEYEKQIAELTKEFQKEKEAMKQRYENRIFYLKENVVSEIALLEQEIEALKSTIIAKDEEFTVHMTAKNNIIEALTAKIAGLEAPSEKEEDSKSRLAPSRSQKRSKSSAQKPQGSQSQMTEREKEKERERRLDDKRSAASGTVKKSKRKIEKPSSHSRPASINMTNLRSSRIRDEAVINNESIMTQENHLENSSASEDRRGSRTSVSSRGVSVQQFGVPSGRMFDDWDGGDEKRKMRKLREFFIRVYDRVLAKKGLVSMNSYNSLESGSDDEGTSEDGNIDIYDQIFRLMADQELCEAAGVKPVDFDNLSIKETKRSSLKKKLPGLLFQRRKKTNFNFVEIIPEIKEEHKDDRGTSMFLNDPEESPKANQPSKGKFFENARENLINFIEAMTNQNLSAETKELPIPKLLEEEVSLSVDRVLTLGDFQEYLRVPIAEVVVTVEQLILNVINFYLSLLSEKNDIIKHYMIGKRTAEKKYVTIQTDTSDLPANKVTSKEITSQGKEVKKINQETQTNPNLYIDLRSTNTPSQFSIPQSLNHSPLKILQESLDSWKHRLFSRRSDVAPSPGLINASLPQDLKNLLTSKREGSTMGLSRKMIDNKLRRIPRPNTSANIIERDMESSMSPRGDGYNSRSIYKYGDPDSEINLQDGRSMWTNVFAEQMAPQSIPMTSGRLLEGTPHMASGSKQIPMTVTYLEMPQKEKGVPKREEIRQRINLEKRRFTSYKEDEEKTPTKVPYKFTEDFSHFRTEGRWAAGARRSSDNNNEVHELCKRTVMALYDYIGNVEREAVNPAKLKIDLKDVNKKISEIEDMLQLGQGASGGDRKYNSLSRYMNKPGSQNQGKKVNRMSGTGESWAVNPLNDVNRSLNQGKKDNEVNKLKEVERKMRIENALLEPENPIEGFANVSSRNWDGMSENLEFRGQSLYASQIKMEEKEVLKDVKEIELDRSSSLALSEEVSNIEEIKKESIARAGSIEKRPGTGDLSRMDILSKLAMPSKPSKGVLPPKGKTDKDREYRTLKKAAFKVKKVSVSRERVSSALNNSII